MSPKLSKTVRLCTPEMPRAFGRLFRQQSPFEKHRLSSYSTGNHNPEMWPRTEKNPHSKHRWNGLLSMRKLGRLSAKWRIINSVSRMPSRASGIVRTPNEAAHEKPVPDRLAECGCQNAWNLLQQSQNPGGCWYSDTNHCPSCAVTTLHRISR